MSERLLKFSNGALLRILHGRQFVSSYPNSIELDFSIVMHRNKLQEIVKISLEGF